MKIQMLNKTLMKIRIFLKMLKKKRKEKSVSQKKKSALAVDFWSNATNASTPPVQNLVWSKTAQLSQKRKKLSDTYILFL
jgi:hypothetical protein